MEAESSPASRTCLHPVHMDRARGKEGGLGPPKTSQRSMDREQESTVSHTVWAERRTKPIGGPRLRRGSATARHMSGLARPKAQPMSRPNRPSLDPVRVDR